MEKNKTTHYCELNCGRKAGPGFHHLIFQSQEVSLKEHPRNKIRICPTCHKTIHDGTMAQIRKLPGFLKMMNRIRELSEEHYQRWLIKLEKAGEKQF